MAHKTLRLTVSFRIILFITCYVYLIYVDQDLTYYLLVLPCVFITAICGSLLSGGGMKKGANRDPVAPLAIMQK